MGERANKYQTEETGLLTFGTFLPMQNECHLIGGGCCHSGSPLCAVQTTHLFTDNDDEPHLRVLRL